MAIRLVSFAKVSLAFVLTFAAQAVPHALAATLPAGSGKPPRLGQGYDSRTGHLRGHCVTGDILYTGTQESSLDVGTARTSDDVRADVEATLETGMDALVVAAEVKGELSSFFAASSLENRYYASAYVRGKRAVLARPRLTATGARAAASGDPQTIRALCGDSYVHEVALGVSFTFALTFRHAESESSSLMKTTYKLKLPFKTLKKTKMRSWRLAASTSAATLEAVQFGGRRSDFEAFRKTLGATRCAQEGVDTCFELAEQALTYVTGEGEGRLKAQIKDLAYSESSPDTNPLLFGKATDYGLLFADGLVPKSAQASRAPQGLAEREGRDARLAESVAWALAHPLLPQERTPALREAARRLDFNRMVYERVRHACLGTEVDCGAEWTRLAAEIFPVDDAVAQRPLRFRDFCEALDDESAWHGTVLAVLRASGTSDCGQAQAWLESSPSLVLRSADIKSLEPLAWLPQATHVDLARNALSGLPETLAWPKVRALNLAHNTLSNVSALRAVPALRTLNLAFNALSAFVWPSPLETVRLYGNFVSRPEVPGAEVLRSETEACVWELRRLATSQTLAPSDAELYISEGMGPEFEWVGGERRATGGFAVCDAMVGTFD